MALDLLLAVGALALLTLVPGPDFAVTVRWAIVAPAHGMRAAAGVVVGLAAWGALTVVGLTALLAASPLAYAVLRYAGAAYLVVLAARLIWRSFRPYPATAPSTALRSPAFFQGLLTDLLNPKVAVFYVTALPALVPQEIPHAAALALLVAIHLVLAAVWLTICVRAIARGRRVLVRPRVRAWLDRVTAAVYVGFAVRLAADSA